MTMLYGVSGDGLPLTFVVTNVTPPVYNQQLSYLAFYIFNNNRNI